MHKSKVIPIIFATLLFLTLNTGYVALGADGTTGSIEDNFGSLVDGQRIYVHCYSLTVSADYLVNHTGDDTGASFSTGSTQTEAYVPIVLDKAVSTEVYVIYLRSQSAGTVIDSVTIFVSDPDDITNEDLFMDLAIPVMIMGIFASIAIGFVKGKRGRR